MDTTSEATIVWEKVLKKLENQLSKLMIDTWLKPTFPLNLTETILEIGVPKQTTKEWLESRYLPDILSALHYVTNKPLNVVFTFVEDTDAHDDTNDTSSENNATKRSNIDVGDTLQATIVWERVIKKIKQELSELMIDTWLRPTIPLNITETILEIGTPKQIIKEWLESRYLPIISSAVHSVTNKPLNVIFINLDVEGNADNSREYSIDVVDKLQATKIWEKALEIIKLELSKSEFDTLQRRTFPLNLTETTLEIGTPMYAIKHLIESKYLTIITSAVYHVTNKSLDVIFTRIDEENGNIDSSQENTITKRFAEKLLEDLISQGLSGEELLLEFRERHQKTLPIELINSHTEDVLTIQDKDNYQDVSKELNCKYTFDNIVVGSHNQMAYQIANDFAMENDRKSQLIYFYSAVGLGKTHLVQAICNHLVQNNLEIKVKYISVNDFIESMIDAISNGNIKVFRKSFFYYDVIIFENLESLKNKIHSQEEFRNIVSDLLDSNKQVIITCTIPPQDMRINEIKTNGLFEINTVCEILKPDFNTKVAIIKQKANYEKIGLSDEIIIAIAQREYENIRELINSINATIATMKFEEQTALKPRTIINEFYDLIRTDIVKAGKPVNEETISGYHDKLNKAMYKLILSEEWNSIQETLYLTSVPGMKAKILKGMKAPLSECVEDD